MERLRKELKKVCENSSIKITSGISFQYEEEIKTLHMVMGKGITENMQENSAAFEAWALAFKANLSHLVDKVTLNWNPNIVFTKNQARHYNRFLYRVANFQEKYKQWFSVLDGKEKSWEKQVVSNNWKILILNSPGNRDVIYELKNVDPTKEHDLEVYFTTVGSEKLKLAVKEKFNILLSEIKNQYPVGLFSNAVSRNTYIFTGGKSAIDLYSIGEDHSFNVFELKAEKNVKLGILSELFFYSSLIRDVIDGKFKCDDLKKITKVNAFFLVPKMHPLLTDKVLDLLNIQGNNISYKKLQYEISNIDFLEE